MHSLSRSLIVPAVVAGWLFTAGLATAAAVAEIRDDGGFFKDQSIRQANEVIRDLKKEHKIDLFIQTYKDIPDDLKKEFEEVKKDRKKESEFFEKWALKRFKEAEVNGIYVLLLKKTDDHPGHLQIEVGDETQKKAFTLENRAKLRELMLAKFGKKEYDEGLLDGVKFVREKVDANLGKGKAHAAPGQVETDDKTAPPVKGLLGGIGGIICIGLVIVLVVWVVFALIRALSGMGGGGYGGGGYGGGGGGYGGGGGFMSGMLGGMFGAAAGSFLYDRFFRGDSGYGGSEAHHGYGSGAGLEGGAGPEDTNASGTGGDFGGDQGDAGGDQGDADGGDAGGDLGGGGFFGGGDAGGGGGDFGGGGGDFGGGGGGGDF